MILHIASKQDWSSAQAKGEYAAPSLATEGFIHFSTDKQAVHVANAFYKGRKDLVLLVVDESKLAAELKWEAPAGPPAENISQSDLFPHLYGPLNLTAVASVLDFQPDPATGAFTLPNP
ncbi:MAG: DUF952 domain-containing protein [Chloroflexi bacterium]|nr:DUF952 domain-containing protein [Chloroflexi bacterium CFX1]MCK6567364.1 DUF952 domain-containing protein [Anaerolineales bacterium]MCQ3953834.1 DUF952 domain-containing protein [Chloroflexota bacterium]MDL1918888.1 DUF952 domain-containing protein [Chloroflexi bacterium CFX5]NUQ59733.1 DUF952 domain-containing protein [Anaerolineales bacterium]